jgi:hypothetical protein
MLSHLTKRQAFLMWIVLILLLGLWVFANLERGLWAVLAGLGAIALPITLHWIDRRLFE